MFEQGEQVSVPQARLGWGDPVEIALHAQGLTITRGSGPVRRPIRLVIEERTLEGDLGDKLAETLVNVQGVVPPQVARDHLGWLRVECVEPEPVVLEGVRWAVNPRVRVLCWDREQTFFSVTPDGDGENRFVDLTTAEAWRLVGILAAVSTWRQRVARRAGEAGQALRRELVEQRCAAIRAARDAWPWPANPIVLTEEALRPFTEAVRKRAVAALAATAGPMRTVSLPGPVVLWASPTVCGPALTDRGETHAMRVQKAENHWLRAAGEETSAAKLFEAGETVAVARPVLPWMTSVEIVVDHDGVRLWPTLGRQERPIRLVVNEPRLCGARRMDLMRALVAVAGVVPAAVGTDRAGRALVPCAHPALVYPGGIDWAVPDGPLVRVTGNGDEAALLVCSEGDGEARDVDLDTSDAWALLTMLAGVAAWRRHVRDRAPRAAAELRLEFLWRARGRGAR